MRRRGTRRGVVASDGTGRREVASALLVRLTQQELARRGLLARPGGTPDALVPVGTASDRAVSGGQVPRREAARSGGAGSPLGLPIVRAFGPTIGEAAVALAPKRALLGAIAARHGLAPLLEVGRGVDRLRAELPGDPVLAALLRAADPADAIARWQRLERFVHSRHRLECAGPAPALPAAAGSNERLIRHVGPPGAPPTPAEDALVLGVVAELCRRAGAVALAVSLVGPNGREHPVLADDRFGELPTDWPALPGGTGLWRFTWTAAPGARPGARARPTLGRPGAPPAPRECPPGAAAADATPLAARLTAVIASDLCRAWTLADAARTLATAAGPSFAPRTLQRRLAAAGATFPGVVRAARVAAAGRLLAEETHTLRVIGFACGFTDQPHFTRQFKRQTGMTPAVYRRAFGRPR